MIGRKSPGLDGGEYGGTCQDRDLLLGKSGPSLLPWRGELPHKVVIAIDGGRQPRQPPFSFTLITRPTGLLASRGDVPDAWLDNRNRCGRVWAAREMRNARSPAELRARGARRDAQLKTAKALGLTVPETLVAIADTIVI
jgi:hypothetical protein